MIYFLTNTIHESKGFPNSKLKFTFNSHNTQYGIFSIPSEYNIDKIINKFTCRHINAYFLRPAVTSDMYKQLQNKNFEKDMPLIKDFSILDPLIHPNFDWYNLIAKFYLKDKKLKYKVLSEETLFESDKIVLYDLNDLIKDEIGCTTPWVEEANKKLEYTNLILRPQANIVTAI